jgi:hypothetical protein
MKTDFDDSFNFRIQEELYIWKNVKFFQLGNEPRIVILTLIIVCPEMKRGMNKNKVRNTSCEQCCFA